MKKNKVVKEKKQFSKEKIKFILLLNMVSSILFLVGFILIFKNMGEFTKAFITGITLATIGGLISIWGGLKLVFKVPEDQIESVEWNSGIIALWLGLFGLNALYLIFVTMFKSKFKYLKKDNKKQKVVKNKKKIQKPKAKELKGKDKKVKEEKIVKSKDKKDESLW